MKSTTTFLFWISPDFILYTVMNLLDLGKDFLFVQCCGPEIMFSDPNPAASLILDPDLGQDLDLARFQGSILDAKLHLHLSLTTFEPPIIIKRIVKKDQNKIIQISKCCIIFSSEIQIRRHHQHANYSDPSRSKPKHCNLSVLHEAVKTNEISQRTK
jgi:hypothetical protein